MVPPSPQISPDSMGLSPAMNFLRGSIPLPPALRLFRVRLTGEIVVEFQASSGRKVQATTGLGEPQMNWSF